MRRFCGMCDKHRTLKWGYSSAGGAPALQAGGHRFETDYLHHFLLKITIKKTFNLVHNPIFNYFVAFFGEINITDFYPH